MTYCLTCYGDDGMAQPISDTFGGGIYSKVLRLNYDHTIQPTLLLHLGIGYNSDDLGRPLVTPNYNACTNLEPVQPGVHSAVRFSQFHGSGSIPRPEAWQTVVGESAIRDAPIRFITSSTPSPA